VLFKKSPVGPIVRTSKQDPPSSDLSATPQLDTNVTTKKDPLEFDTVGPEDYEGYEDYYAEYYDDEEEGEPEE